MIRVRLKDGYLLYLTGDTSLLVPARGKGETMIRANGTAAFILSALQTDTDRKTILNEVTEKYAVSQERAEKDLASILEQLERLGVLQD